MEHQIQPDEPRQDQSLKSTTADNQTPAIEKVMGNAPGTTDTTEWGFSKLPYEIRQRIWLETFEPRTLTITRIYSQCHVGGLPESNPGWNIFVARQGMHSYTGDDRDIDLVNMLFLKDFVAEAKPRTPVGPAALFVCQESRELALKRYELAFGGMPFCSKRGGDERGSGICKICKSWDSEESKQWMESGWGRPRIWVDFQRDTFYIQDIVHSLSPWKTAPELKKIRKLALGYRPPTKLLPWQFEGQGRVRVAFQDVFEAFLVAIKQTLLAFENDGNLETVTIYYCQDITRMGLPELQQVVHRWLSRPSSGTSDPGRPLLGSLQASKIKYERLSGVSEDEWMST